MDEKITFEVLVDGMDWDCSLDAAYDALAEVFRGVYEDMTIQPSTPISHVHYLIFQREYDFYVELGYDEKGELESYSLHHLTLKKAKEILKDFMEDKKIPDFSNWHFDGIYQQFAGDVFALVDADDEF